MAQELKRKLTAILSADVKGYSRLMGEDEEWTVRTLDTFKGVNKTIIPQHRGRVVDLTGDNQLAEFASVVNVVQAAVEIQQVLKANKSLLPEPLHNFADFDLDSFSQKDLVSSFRRARLQ